MGQLRLSLANRDIVILPRILQMGCVCVYVCAHSVRTAAHQGPLSMEISRQDYWIELPFPPPGDLPNPGMEPQVSYVSCIGRQILYH